MDPRARPYYSYGNPTYNWGYSGYNPPSYGYPTAAPANYPPPVRKSSQPGEKDGDDKDKTVQNKGLVAAVVILALLLLAVIIALIVVGTLYQQKGQSPVTTTTAAPATTTTQSAVLAKTIVGFSVTRNDMTYVDAMSDPASPTFTVTCNLFCDMICNSWLEGKITTDDCKCSQLRPGSVIADIELSADSSFGTPESILSTLRLAIPYKSEQDSNTNTVNANDIVILTSDAVTMQPVSPSTAVISFSVNRNDMTYEDDMAERTSLNFNITCNLFCEMICIDWLERNINQDACDCTALRPGSVIADIALTVNVTDVTPESVLSIMRLAIPVKSAMDQRTNTVDANDIVLEQLTDGTSDQNAPNSVETGTENPGGATETPMEPTTPTTVFGFNVTRTDLKYVPDLADSTSSMFKNASYLFCDMIMREWLMGILPTEACNCAQFWSGSVRCEGHVEVNANATSAEEILKQVGPLMVYQSTMDTRTAPLQASDIFIVN